MQLKIHKDKMHQEDKEYFEIEIAEDDLKYPCLKCTDKFVSKNSLKVHNIHHNSKYNYSEYDFLKTECFDKTISRFKCNLYI